MSASNSSDYELLTEHFSYPPVSLLDDIINTVNVLADRALDSVERLLLSIPPNKLGFPQKSRRNGDATPADDDDAAAAAKREIENGTHQLETLLNASIDKNFDLFELYTMRNILTVRPQDRPYMRLAHYDGLDLPLASSHSPQHQVDRPTVESVTALRRRLQASQKLHVALEAERVRNDALLRKLKALLGLRDQAEGEGDVKKEDRGARDELQPSPFGFLGDKGNLTDGGSEQPITTTTEFALSQLQALRSLSVSLRTLLPDLGTADPATGQESDGDDDDEAVAAASNKQQRASSDKPHSKSWRRERAEYIEASSRKYLERVGGLELGPRGDVRDGEWPGEGRRLTRDEVDGLERTAAVLGGGGGGGTGGLGERRRAEDAMDDDDAPATGGG
ncbi:mis12 protein [Hirsutella rhossiliensis]|uniref:Mis12 protein n=1 Tax=Hirsutella rhossiliensis TaxID=111463 RepID=A0A9P8MTB5_9HYPO|nr:mis12 protein [Hirsutella rhossiliensis]KAH0960029.1 mis12 protein [Hirsutella rhossiliensis]